LTQSARNSVENASQDTSVDFSHFNVDQNREEEIYEYDNEIIKSTENNVREKPIHTTQIAKTSKTSLSNFKQDLFNLEAKK